MKSDVLHKVGGSMTISMVVKPVFQDLQFVLDLSATSFKAKSKLKKEIAVFGGYISYILTNKTNFLIVSHGPEHSNDTYKTRKARQLRIPVVSSSYVEKCIENHQLLDVDDFIVYGETKKSKFIKGKVEVAGWKKKEERRTKDVILNPKKTVFCKFSSGSKECPKYQKEFAVANFAAFKEDVREKNGVCCKRIHVFELHIPADYHAEKHKQSFRVLEQTAVLKDNELANKDSNEYFFDSCSQALMVMQQLVDGKKANPKMQSISNIPYAKNVILGSVKLRKMLDDMGASAGVPHPEIAKLALGLLKNWKAIEALGICKKITADEITKAVVLLMKLRDALNDGKDTSDMSRQFSSCIHMRETTTINDKRTLSMFVDIVQLIKDMKLLVESVDGDALEMALPPPAVALSMLRCSITYLHSTDEEYKIVFDLIHGKNEKNVPAGFRVRNIFSVHRDVEDAAFTHSISPKKMLFHASRPENFIGIFSRGLLPPLVVVGDHGGERSDCGMLGSGIYFADDVRTSCLYSQTNKSSGTRLLLVSEVCLGNCKTYTNFQPNLIKAPKGYDSVCGVGVDTEPESTFKRNEYAIFEKNQQRMRYLVEFTMDGDEIMPQDDSFQNENERKSVDISLKEVLDTIDEEVNLDDINKAANAVADYKMGLIVKDKGDDVEVPLQQVHIRGKIMDMVAEVVVFQAYVNESSEAMEAKYVFPLTESSAVCGFEAFINGKHVVGKVKEKEIAHKEYREAISAGHGAYLMDQEKPDVFTVSVGNLPPGAEVAIKITYVCELPVKVNEDDMTDYIEFHLPGCLASSVKNQVLIAGPVTQTTVDRVSADSTQLSDFSLVLSAEMPFDIKKLLCPTNKIITKQTLSKACVRLAKKECIGSEGFKLLISLAEIHVPRMWVESHSSTQAAMVAFYPEFDVAPINSYRALIMIDMSRSISSEQNFEMGLKKMALLLLKSLPGECFINVVRFGSSYDQLFITEKPLGDNKVANSAERFIQSCRATYGGSDAWRPLSMLAKLKPFLDYPLTNVFLLTDGHLSEENTLLQIARSLGGATEENVARIFTLSLGSSANQHLLRSIALASGGAHEHFDLSAKSKWEPKVKGLLSKAGQPVLTDIRIEWKTFNDDKDRDANQGLPHQAPEHISTLFNSSRLVAYSFVPDCTQAVLYANVCGREISTVVSTSELSITNGQTLHRLAARAMIADYEDGMHEVDPLIRDELKRSRKPQIIDLSIRYSIVSPYTSFVAVEERKEGEDVSADDGPCLADLVSQVNVDALPEISWPVEDDENTYDKVADAIRQAEITYFTSVDHSMRMFGDVEKLIPKLDTDYDQKKALLLSAATRKRLGLTVSFLPETPSWKWRSFFTIADKKNDAAVQELRAVVEPLLFVTHEISQDYWMAKSDEDSYDDIMYNDIELCDVLLADYCYDAASCEEEMWGERESFSHSEDESSTSVDESSTSVDESLTCVESYNSCRVRSPDLEQQSRSVYDAKLRSFGRVLDAPSSTLARAPSAAASGPVHHLGRQMMLMCPREPTKDRIDSLMMGQHGPSSYLFDQQDSTQRQWSGQNYLFGAVGEQSSDYLASFDSADFSSYKAVDRVWKKKKALSYVASNTERRGFEASSDVPIAFGEPEVTYLSETKGFRSTAGRAPVELGGGLLSDDVRGEIDVSTECEPLHSGVTSQSSGYQAKLATRSAKPRMPFKLLSDDADQLTSTKEDVNSSSFSKVSDDQLRVSSSASLARNAVPCCTGTATFPPPLSCPPTTAAHQSSTTFLSPPHPSTACLPPPPALFATSCLTPPAPLPPPPPLSSDTITHHTVPSTALMAHRSLEDDWTVASAPLLCMRRTLRKAPTEKPVISSELEDTSQFQPQSQQAGQAYRYSSLSVSTRARCASPGIRKDYDTLTTLTT